MMRALYEYSIPAMWLAWLLFWGIAAIGAKAIRARESFTSHLSHTVPLALGVWLFAALHVPLAWLGTRLWPRSPGCFWAGFCLVTVGLALSVAARAWLGGNWSGTVTLKQEHELIRSGPYRWVRHPIYTGLLLALLGSAIALGEWRGLIGTTLIMLAFLRKISVEERFLTQQFGAAYIRYRNEVPALLPMPYHNAG